MAFSANLSRWLFRSALWGILVTSLWLLLAQLFAIAMSVSGYWQVPRIRSVRVMRFETDPQNAFTDQVYVLHGQEQKVCRMLKSERAQLQPDQDIWLLDNVFASAVRPAQYRVSLARLFLQFGPLLLPILMWVLVWEYRRPLANPDTDPRSDGRPRRILQDDFHTRAERFRKD